MDQYHKDWKARLKKLHLAAGEEDPHFENYEWQWVRLPEDFEVGRTAPASAENILMENGVPRSLSVYFSNQRNFLCPACSGTKGMIPGDLGIREDSKCIECGVEAAHMWDKQHPEKARARAKRYRETEKAKMKTRERVRRYRLKKKNLHTYRTAASIL